MAAPIGYTAWDGTYRKWRYSDEERAVERFACCYDCQRPYGTWPDMPVSNEVWELINPTQWKGSGLLCPSCIGDRLNVLNRGVDVQAVFRLGGG